MPNLENASKLIGQANGILGVILTLVAHFRTVRAAAAAANPQLPDGEIPDDADLIELLRLDAVHLEERATQLQTKYQGMIP